MDAYSGIIEQLNKFIKKHNTNALIKGAVYALLLSLIVFLLVISLEYFGAFSSKIRTVLAISSLLCLSYILIRFIALPLAQLLQLKKGIGHKEAAELLGKHFPSVSDKLINVLELKNLNESEEVFIKEIVAAGIEQKAEELKPIPFLSAIDFKENLKYAKWILFPLSIILFAALVFPEFLTEPSKRVIAFNEEFKPKAPFNLIVQNRKVEVLSGQDAIIDLRLDNAKALPNEVYAQFGSYREPFKKIADNHYQIVFSRINKSFSFTLGADEFEFGQIEIISRPSPSLNEFNLRAEYPAHTRLQAKSFSNVGDITVPQGSRLIWTLKSSTADSLNIYGLENITTSISPGEVVTQWKANSNTRYGLYRSNQYATIIDSNIYSVKIIPDEYPQIEANFIVDSAGGDDFAIASIIADDYGFTSLKLHYKTSKATDFQNVSINISKYELRQQVAVQKTFSALGIKPGDNFEYYLEVADNDAPNGYKRSKTSISTFYLKSTEELKQERNDKLDKNQDSLEKLLKQNEQLNKQLKNIRQDLLNKKKPDLNDKRKLQSLLDEKRSIQEKLEQLKKENQQTEQLQKQLDPEKEELLKKQEELNDLMDELMNDELKQMYEELEKLMQELDQDKLLEKLEQLEKNTDNLNKEMDRSLELLKKFALELKKEDFIEELNKLAEKQEELSKSDENKEEISKQQQEINKEFKKQEEKLKDIIKEEKALEEKSNSEELKKDAESLEKELDKNLEDIQQNKSRKNTKQDQKKNAEKMEKMAESMQSSMASASSEENAENIEDLKQILENLVDLSFNQEGLYQTYGELSSQDPLYSQEAIKQVNYAEDFKIIEDSLNALAKRVPQIQSIVYKEIAQVKSKMQESSENLAERMTSQARMEQRYALTSLNNLSLLLNEVLNSLEKKQSQSKPGMANCSKPSSGSSGKPSLKKMREAQEQMAKKMEEMMKQGKKGSKGESKGESQKGEGEDSNSNAEELVKMAAKHAAIRKQLRELAKELNKDGKGNGNSLNELAKEIEELEKDLFNGKINPESLMRQREILNKMLEEENAERTQELDNERKGDRANPISKPSPQWEEYLKNKNTFIEKLESVPTKLNPYYKQKSEDYLNQETND